MQKVRKERKQMEQYDTNDTNDTGVPQNIHKCGYPNSVKTKLIYDDQSKPAG